jgi:F-type H+-transporting ATPase subunit a
VANRKLKKATEVPDGFQNILELIVELLDNMVKGSMGKWAPGFRNYIGTIFVFILVSNISGLLGLRPPTADYGTTLCLGLITFFLIHINTFKHQSVKQIWIDKCSPLPPWLPIWLPINVISDIAVPISLSLRLFANVLSGTVMMALVYGLLNKLAVIWPAALHVYFDLFSGAIQTYVFCMLTMTYIANACGDTE